MAYEVPFKKDFFVFSGNTLPISLKVKGESGYLNLYGYTFTMKVVDDSMNSVWDFEQEITENIEEFTFLVNTDLEPQSYFYELEMTEPGGYKTTLLYGKIIIYRGTVE